MSRAVDNAPLRLQQGYERCFMTIDLKSTYRNFPPPLRADDRIRTRLEKLAKLYPDILSCEFLGEALHGRDLRGKRYRIAIAVGLSGGETVTDHGHAIDHAHEDFFVAVDDAFDALERVLRSHEADRAVRG